MLKVALVTLAVLTAPAHVDTIELPSPDAAKVQASNLIRAVGGRPDRLLQSVVPGPVVNDETVRVGVGGTGAVQVVTADQRLALSGTGDYAIRERGPARSARSLNGDPPPVTRRGAVVWQGFSPGRRSLAATLILDPALEAPHLPLTVTVAFDGAHGHQVLTGGRIPEAGTVTVTLANTTSQPAVLPTAGDVSAAAVAGPLDRALAVARNPSALRLPTTDDLLPTTLPVTGAARSEGSQAVPLRLTGTLQLRGTTGTVTGPATVALPDGATFAGTLGGVQGTPTVTFTVVAAGPGTLALDLSAVNALNPSELLPAGFPTWKAWAAAGPSAASRKAALDLLVEVAASGARASSYSPYLGADLGGTGSTTFVYSFAPSAQAAAVARVLHPRWGALTLAGLGLLLLLGVATAVWRRS